MKWTTNQKRLLAAVCVAFCLIALTYAWVTPPLEASDEFKHYPVVWYVQQNLALPVLDPTDPGMWEQQAAQPPLYYLLMGVWTRLLGIDTAELPEMHDMNEHFFVGNTWQIKNKNIITHDPELERWPFRGVTLAIFVIRVTTILLSVGTLLLTAELGRRMFSAEVGLLAAALTAFMPMFAFTSAATNNDPFATLLGALGLALLVAVWQEQPDPLRHWWRYALLGGVLGLGMTSKLSLGGLVGVAGVALALLAWQKRRWQLFFIGGPIVLGTALLASSWFFLRNWRLYGDLTALNVFVEVQGVRDEPLDLAGWWGEFGTFYRTYWGLFGGVNIAAPEWMYNAYNILLGVGFLGLIKRRLEIGHWRIFSSEPQSAVGETGNSSGDWIIVAFFLALFALLINWTIIYFSFQGRLVFPALAGINVLWAAGLCTWARPWGQLGRRLLVGLAVAMGLISAVLPWSHIAPNYAYPQPLAAVPPEAAFGPIRFETAAGEAFSLVGVEVPSGQSIEPGGRYGAELVLYWRAETPLSKDYLTSIHLLGRDMASAGQVDRYPGWGMVPTSKWQPGQIWRDPYAVWARPSAQGPARLLFSVSATDTRAGERLHAIGPDGSDLPLVTVGEARLAGREAREAAPANPLVVDMADGVTFLGYEVEEAAESRDLRVRLFWRANATPQQDYTVFVQLLGADGQPIANGDSPPVNGFYPTRLWQAGDLVVDEHLLAVPPELPVGIYQIAVGLYEPGSGARMGRLDGGDAIVWEVELGK